MDQKRFIWTSTGYHLKPCKESKSVSKFDAHQRPGLSDITAPDGATGVKAVGNEPLLAALALALVDAPRATLHELSHAVGVSKATLYRHWRTRDELVDCLAHHAIACLQQALEESRLDEGPAIEALDRFVRSQLQRSELAAFLVYYWQPESVHGARFASSCEAYLSALDRFILRGQREGVFRIDIGAQAQAEALIALLTGLIDAVHRGRVARAGVAAVVRALFLRGSSA